MEREEARRYKAVDSVDIDVLAGSSHCRAGLFWKQTSGHDCCDHALESWERFVAYSERTLD